MFPSREDGGDGSCAAIIPLEQYRGTQRGVFKTASSTAEYDFTNKRRLIALCIPKCIVVSLLILITHNEILSLYRPSYAQTGNTKSFHVINLTDAALGC